AQAGLSAPAHIGDTPDIRSPMFDFLAPPPTVTYTLSLHDALPICCQAREARLRRIHPEFVAALRRRSGRQFQARSERSPSATSRSEEHTSELQSLRHLVCRLLLEKKKLIRTQQGYKVATARTKTHS